MVLWTPTGKSSFQSIGVTKDWRLGWPWFYRKNGLRFPINRRHQGLTTAKSYVYSLRRFNGFPINRRHQGLATGLIYFFGHLYPWAFPINRRHQGLATEQLAWAQARAIAFPINRRHQGLATLSPRSPRRSMRTRLFPINRRHQGLATFLVLV